jgi:cobalt/nickel transport system permease protein
MHISEGVLTFPVIVGGYALTAVGVAIGLRSLEGEKIVRTAIFSSAFFIASLIHVPIGPSNVHLVLNGLVGVVLGWQAFCALLVGLAAQALLFQYGGLTTLGVNTFNMALPALICYYLCHRGIVGSQKASLGFGFLAGFLGVFLSGMLLATSLFLSGEHFLPAAKIIVAAHAPIMVIEGFVTAFVVRFIRKVKPEIFY